MAFCPESSHPLTVDYKTTCDPLAFGLFHPIWSSHVKTLTLAEVEFLLQACTYELVSVRHTI